MAIIQKDAFFGEGISSYGEINPQIAFRYHRKEIRTKRLSDLLGKDSKLQNYEIEQKFEQIKAALEAADKQVINDNKEFMEKHGIVI
jgi:hypothetical protein